MPSHEHQIRIQTEAFDLGVEERSLRTRAHNCGAIVAFMGLVRELNKIHTPAQETPVQSIFLEHYPGVTENAIQNIVDEATQRWPLSAVTVIHRVGQLLTEEPIVLVLVASAHRQAAFDAAQYIMDILKSQAPFWKKEQLIDGSDLWVDAKSSDADAAQKWQPNDQQGSS